MTVWVFIGLAVLLGLAWFGALVWWCAGKNRLTRSRRRWEQERVNAIVRASQGEHLPRLEREYYELPDWTK